METRETKVNQKFGLFAVADATLFELTYALPDDIELPVPGSLFILPVQKRQCVGVFLELCEAPSFVCKMVGSPLFHTKKICPEILNLGKWLANYYLAPFSKCVRLLAPGFLWDVGAAQKRQKRFAPYFPPGSSLAEYPIKNFSTSIRGEFSRRNSNAAVNLTGEQQKCVDGIFAAQQTVTLLQGITGSGKTEVYLKAAQHVISEGRNVLVLVPEIALTPQMSGRFRDVFGEDLAVLHSGLTPVEYEREWFRAHWGQAKILLGVRSAVFAPLENLGLIIVDEEHDSSYKCDEFPCYHARDVAVKRASLEKARCVLGSATPSLESFQNVVSRRYDLQVLKARVTGNLPEVKVIDAKSFMQLRKLGQTQKKSLTRSSLVKFNGNVIAPPVIDLLKKTKERGEQSIVILNRRGFANYCLCATCGNSLRCPHCSVTTTLHKSGERELCHYCGFTRPTLQKCPECSHSTLLAMGAGTQNIEAEIGGHLPELHIGRLDRDMLTSTGRLTQLLEAFRSGALDCLVGTQILAKGHDFPKVTTVVILHVEDGLFLPDYRASERTFQLVTQASGRAGRSSLPGTVVLQSLVIGHPVIEYAINRDVNGFLRRELELRKLGWHPPFVRQILFEFAAKNEAAASKRAQEYRDTLIEHWKNIGIPPEEVRIVGPYPATLERLREEYRFHLCISSLKSIFPQKLVPASLMLSKIEGGVKMRIDVDPFSFL